MMFWIILYIVLMIVIYSLVKNHQTNNTALQIDDKKDKFKECSNAIKVKTQAKSEGYKMQRYNNIKPQNIDTSLIASKRESIISHNNSYTQKNNSFPPPLIYPLQFQLFFLKK